MKNSKLRRALLLVASAVLLVSVSVSATLAYLTSTDAVTNTFSVGKVAITLDEADVDDSDKDDNTTERDKANVYHLMPGHEYAKDPIVHISADSENCFVYVKVENGIAAIEDSANTIEAQMTANGNWTLLDGETNIYYYKEVVGAGMNIPVFTTFKIAGTVDNATLLTYQNAAINVTAYAVQNDGFASAQAAWDATFGAPTTPDAGETT